VNQTINQKEKESDEVMLKAQIERENLKGIHTLIDIEEKRNNIQDQ